jgi:hypothetical protein
MHKQGLCKNKVEDGRSVYQAASNYQSRIPSAFPSLLTSVGVVNYLRGALDLNLLAGRAEDPEFLCLQTLKNSAHLANQVIT